MKKYYLLVLALVANIAFNSFAADKVVKEKIDAASSEYVANRFMNGSYMFCDDNGVIKKGAKGFHSLKSNKELEPGQQMPIASATKTMTAAGILKLRDRGLLDVDDPVAKHLGADSDIWEGGKVPAWANKVTLHNLLTHRSGLPEYFMGMKIDITKPHKEINKDIANYAASKELAFAPGSEHHYCNTNFVLLGLIIEKVSGKNLGDFYDEELFHPLEMKDTRLISLQEAVEHQTDADATTYPVRYFVTPTGQSQPYFTEAKADFIMVPFSDGGVVSTTEDLIKWQKALHNGKVLSDSSYKLMTTRHYKVEDYTGIKNYMGYGIYISELEGGEIVYHHAGRALAIRSESGFIPSKNLYFAVLSNVMDYVPQEMMDKIDWTSPENQLDIKHFMQHMFKAIK